jgi:DNA-binding NarL/FixJ family response regulator
VASLQRAEQPCRVVVLTARNDPALMGAALDAGALGFLHKSRGINVLLDVVRRVAADEVVVEGSFARRRTPDDGSAALRRLAGYLTERERECLGMLVAGLDTNGMASRLGVSQTTVRSHVQAVLAKLGVHSRLEAATLAMRHGLCDDIQGESTGSADKARARTSSEFITRRRQSSTP